MVQGAGIYGPALFDLKVRNFTHCGEVTWIKYLESATTTRRIITKTHDVRDVRWQADRSRQ